MRPVCLPVLWLFWQSGLWMDSMSEQNREDYPEDISESDLQNNPDSLILLICRRQESTEPARMDVHHHKASCPEYPDRRSVPSGKRKSQLLYSGIPYN